MSLPHNYKTQSSRSIFQCINQHLDILNSTFQLENSENFKTYQDKLIAFINHFHSSSEVFSITLTFLNIFGITIFSQHKLLHVIHVSKWQYFFFYSVKIYHMVTLETTLNELKLKLSTGIFCQWNWSINLFACFQITATMWMGILHT